MKKTLTIVTFLVLTISLLAITFTSNKASAQKGKIIHVQPVVLEPQLDFVPGRLLVKFRPEIGLDNARQVIAALGTRDADEIPEIGVHVLELPYQASEVAVQRAFKARPEVEFAELDRLHPAQQQMIPNDPFYDNVNSWSLPKIDALDAWTINTGSSSVIIAILDTGVDATHPDLASQIVPGWNVYNNSSDTSDVYGHGTAVAGAAAAASNNAIGVTSVAWGCKIMPVRISDTSGQASESAIASGLSWAANHGARIANISYYVTGSRTISSAAKSFQSKGGVVIAAAGNYGISESTGDDPYIVTVGATDPSDILYTWSSRGNNLDLVAPGNVFTTLMGGSYGTGGGTSFAAPVVAGVAALVLSNNSMLTPLEVQNILRTSADDLGDFGWDPNYGYGRVNAYRAVLASQTAVGTMDLAAPTVSITAPNSGVKVTGTVNVEVEATDNVGVVRNELYVDGVLKASSTTAPFTLKWNTRKATAGMHQLECRAYDRAGNVGNSSSVTAYK
jgi:thermitase